MDKATLPKAAQKELAAILALELEAVLPEQLAVLKARIDYLTEEEKAKYGLAEAPVVAGGKAKKPKAEPEA